MGTLSRGVCFILCRLLTALAIGERKGDYAEKGRCTQNVETRRCGGLTERRTDAEKELDSAVCFCNMCEPANV